MVSGRIIVWQFVGTIFTTVSASEQRKEILILFFLDMLLGPLSKIVTGATLARMASLGSMIGKIGTVAGRF